MRTPDRPFVGFVRTATTGNVTCASGGSLVAAERKDRTLTGGIQVDRLRRRVPAVAGLLIAAAVHLWLVPSELTESAVMGVAFAGYAAAALVAAARLARRGTETAWRLAGVIGAAGVIAFVLSRLGALPGACP